VEEDDKDEATNNGVGLGDLGALLEVVEHGIFGELLIELVDVERGLVLGLNVDGVLLELLGSRHGG